MVKISFYQEIVIFTQRTFVFSLSPSRQFWTDLQKILGHTGKLAHSLVKLAIFLLVFNLLLFETRVLERKNCIFFHRLKMFAIQYRKNNK